MLVYSLTPTPQVLIYQLMCAIVMQSLRTHNALSSERTMGYLDTDHQLLWAFCFPSNTQSLEILFLNT